MASASCRYLPSRYVSQSLQVVILRCKKSLKNTSSNTRFVTRLMYLTEATERCLGASCMCVMASMFAMQALDFLVTLLVAKAAFSAYKLSEAAAAHRSSNSSSHCSNR
jgi:hypothetical protein